MQGLTLAVALLASGAILVAPARYVLPIFLGAVAWYPCYLAVSLGTVDFTVSRIAIVAVLARLLLGGDSTAHFRWGWVDTFVVLALVGECVAGLMTSPARRVIENRAGGAFDTALPYFAVRLAVRTREDYKALLRSLVVIAAPLALFGAYQCVTGHNPIGFLRRYSYIAATMEDWPLYPRRGFWRAEGTFGVHISFGLFFAMMGPICAGLWPYTRRKGLLGAGLALMVVGVLSSMSSGPQLAGIVACGVMALYPFRRYWKVFAALLIIWLAAINAGSNRQWYDVLGSYCTLDSGTAWYRTRLMEVALGGGMRGHWLAGYGRFVDPGWGPLITGQQGTDITNQYVLVLVRYGLLGLLPFLGTLAGGFLALRRGYVRATGRAERWVIWAMLSALAGMLAAMFSVALMDQITNLFFILLALCVNAAQASLLQAAGCVSEATPMSRILATHP